MNLIKSADSWIAVQSNRQVETPLPFNTNLNIFAGGMPLPSDSHLTACTENFIYQVRIDIPYIENLSYREYFLKKMGKKPLIQLFLCGCLSMIKKCFILFIAYSLGCSSQKRIVSVINSHLQVGNLFNDTKKLELGHVSVLVFIKEPSCTGCKENLAIYLNKLGKKYY